MSETQAEYKTDTDDFNLDTFIERDLIKGSHDRMHPILNKLAESIKENPSASAYQDFYIELEKLMLETAKLAVEYRQTKESTLNGATEM